VWEHPGHVHQPPQAASPSASHPGAGRAPGPPGTRRRAVCPGHFPGRGRPPAGRLAPERGPLACPLAGRRHYGIADARADWPPPKVADEQLEAIEQALLKGALAHGFPTEVWTLERIAVVIQGLTGVALSNPSVWRLLRDRLGWTVQRPERQATERDQEAIQHWVAHEWPRIKKGPAQNRPGSSSSTNQASR
jgi:transposase